MEKISNIWPFGSKKEKIIIKKVLKSNRLNFWTGKNCKLFEMNYQKYSLNLI